MKAIQLVRYGPAKTAFKTAEVPTPKLNNKEDILIQVHAFGLNFADIKLINFKRIKFFV